MKWENSQSFFFFFKKKIATQMAKISPSGPPLFFFHKGVNKRSGAKIDHAQGGNNIYLPTCLWV